MALVLLGVLAALAAGLAMAAIDGASRTESAYARMRTRQLGADVVFFPSQAGFSDADLSKLDQIPEVAAWAGFSGAPGALDEVPGATARRSWPWDRVGSPPSSGPRSSPGGCRIPTATTRPSSTRPRSSRRRPMGFGLGTT